MSEIPPDDNSQQFDKLKEELETLRKENEALKSASGSAPTEKEETKPATSETAMDVGLDNSDVTLRRLVQRIAMILQAEKIVIMFYESESGELMAIPPAYGVEEEKLASFRVRATQEIGRAHV